MREDEVDLLVVDAVLVADGDGDEEDAEDVVAVALRASAAARPRAAGGASSRVDRRLLELVRRLLRAAPRASGRAGRSRLRPSRPRIRRRGAAYDLRRLGFGRGAVSAVPRGPPAAARKRSASRARHTAAAGGGDRLAVDVILDVARREDAGDVRLGRARLRHEVAVLVVVELVDEELRVRVVADRDEERAGVDLLRLAGLGVAQPQPADRVRRRAPPRRRTAS